MVQQAMIDTLYVFLRGASGFSFMILGLGFLAEPGKRRVTKAFGALFVALGFVFLFSWFSEYWVLPLVLDNLLLIAAVFAISQALFEISIYLFGDEKTPGLRRRVYWIGAAWSFLLWCLPFLDQAFGLPVLQASVEDARPMALFQTISSTAIYVWPVVITLISMRAGRWQPGDIPNDPGVTRALLIGTIGVLPIFSLIALGFILSSQLLYRSGHLALTLMIFAWYYYFRARPDAFLKARQQIGQRHKLRESLSPEEVLRISRRLEHLVQVEQVFREPDLSLVTLASKMRIPSYRLSAYFNAELGISFPTWLNTERIDYVCGLLEKGPGLSILEISLEAGYASKAVFNNQFQKRTGLSPREYRAKAIAKSCIDSTNQDDIQKTPGYQ